VNYPLRLLVQPEIVRLTVQDAEGTAVFYAEKRPDPKTPKEDLIVVAADAELAQPLYTLSRFFPRWLQVQDADRRDLCMLHEHLPKEGPWGLDIYDVGDLTLRITRYAEAPARSGGLGGVFKGLVTRAAAPSGYQVTTLDDTPVLRLQPDPLPNQYRLDRLGPLSDMNERRVLIALLGVILQPIPRPTRRR
jgi:hypothetical protein